MRTLLTAGLLFTLIVPSARGAEPANPAAMILAFDALQGRLGDKNLLLLDGRPQAEYAKGNIPGTLRVDLKAFQETIKPEPEAGLEAWSRWVAGLGIGPDTEVYVYDADRQHGASRVWWLLSYAGFGRIGLIDGGFPLWESQGRTVTAEVSARSPRDFPIRFRAGRNAGREAVLSTIEGRSALLLDARSPAEYRCESKGQGPKPPKRLGPIPTALVIEAYDLVDADGRFLDESTRRERLSKAGAESGRPVITYSASGGRSALISFVLERLGNANRLDYLGWNDWAAAETPIAVGQAPRTPAG